MEKNPNPTKDQHFMVDRDMLSLIYDTAQIQPGESIVEIGGGEGALTDYLIQGNNFVTVIEKDPYYATFLKRKYENNSNVIVIEGDALAFNFNGYDRIVANLPYTITEPFLINLASSGALDYNVGNPNGSQVKSITLVLSQNSTRKMVAPVQITEGNSRHMNQEFGIMGAICKAFCDVDIVKAIPSKAFFPEPAVTSFVVNLTPKKEKTTVDRIMRELLIDKKGNKPSIKRAYQMLLARGIVYKQSKHKDDITSMPSASVTSKNIENQNIYDLAPQHISQLVQDLVRNDISIKSRNSGRVRRQTETVNCDNYFVDGKLVLNQDGDYDDDYEQEEILSILKEKYARKYDDLYDSRKYDVLLHRGLETVDQDELQQALGCKNENHKLNSNTYCKQLKLLKE